MIGQTDRIFADAAFVALFRAGLGDLDVEAGPYESIFAGRVRLIEEADSGVVVRRHPKEAPGQRSAIHHRICRRRVGQPDSQGKAARLAGMQDMRTAQERAIDRHGGTAAPTGADPHIY